MKLPELSVCGAYKYWFFQ